MITRPAAIKFALVFLAVVVAFAVAGWLLRDLEVSVARDSLLPMKVRFGERRGQIVVTIANASNVPVKFWELNNSWGYQNFAVELRRKGDKSQKIHVVTAKDMDFTVNPASYAVVSAGSSTNFTLEMLIGRWLLPEGLNLSNDVHQVRVRMTSQLSPEAQTYGVFVGELLSDWTCCLDVRSKETKR